MLTTVAVVIGTHNLSLGVLAGVLLSGIFFACKVQRMFAVERTLSDDGKIAHYRVGGHLFFASVEPFVEAMDVAETAPNFATDMTSAHFWDISGIAALDKIIARLRRDERNVEVVGYNRASTDIVDKFALHDKTRFELGFAPH